MGSKWPSYPNYRESTIKWIGDIPHHWGIYKVKHVARCTNSGVWGEDEGVADIDVGVLRTADLTMAGEILESPPVRSLTAAEWREYKLRKDDMVVVKSSGSIDNVISGKCALVTNQESLAFSNFLLRLRPNPEQVAPKLLFYFLSSHIVRERIKLMVSGTTYPNLKVGEYLSFELPLPSIEEQHHLVAYLDHETAKIDRLIAKQEQLIELLKEKRQAVISHTVTKGLNPNAPMKDSGVEGLGEVPAHWEVARLKHVATLQSGVAKGRDLAGKDTIRVPYLRVANVQDGYLALDDVAEIEIQQSELTRYLLREGDVLMNEGGDNDKLGRGTVWRCEIEPCIHQNHVFAIRPQRVEPEWLTLVTQTSYAKFYFFSIAKQSTNLASISSTNIKETPLVIPPVDERGEIRQFVDAELDKYDRLMSLAYRQIGLLTEHRTALISAAVTGKIDVRSWQQPNTEPQEAATAVNA